MDRTDVFQRDIDVLGSIRQRGRNDDSQSVDESDEDRQTSSRVVDVTTEIDCVGKF